MSHIIFRQKELLKNVTKTCSCSNKIGINKVADGESLSVLVPLVLGFPLRFVWLAKAEILPAAL